MLWLEWEINSAIFSNTVKPHMHEIQTEKHVIQQSPVRAHTHTHTHTQNKITTSMLTQFQCCVND